MLKSVFHALLVAGVMCLAAVSCGKNSHNGEPEKPVVRYLEISSPVIEIDGKAQVETVGINTNYETINVSGGDTWCTYRLAGDNKSITLTIKLNDGDARQASVILTGVADEGEVTRSILVKQNKGIVEYTLDCSTIDFEASKVIDVMHQNKRLVEKTRARDPLQRLHLTPRYENALTPLNEIKLTPTEKTLQGIFL